MEARSRGGCCTSLHLLRLDPDTESSAHGSGELLHPQLVFVLSWGFCLGGDFGFPLFYSLIVLLLYPHYCLTERFTVYWTPQLLPCS